MKDGPDLRVLADRLSGERCSGLTRRPRQALAPAQEEAVAKAVAAAKGGDPEALRFLYLRFADQVYGYVRSIVRDEHEAEDVTQHVFAKLLLVIDRYEPRSVPFARWLLRLAHNAAVDHLRGHRCVPVAEVFGLDEVADDGAAERLRTLRAALERVPDDQRQVLVLRHVAGLTPSEIASRMSRTTSAVHSLHHRGRAALRAALRELGAAPVTLRRAA